MRHYALLALFCFLVSFGAATPIPTGSDGKPVDKGNGRAGSPPSNRPNTPTPEHDPTVPLPGRTGQHIDHGARIVTLFYGDDTFPEHMGHLQRNQKEFPKNRNPMSLTKKIAANRDAALHNIPLAGPHPVTGADRARDEKMPAMLLNPDHSTSTTVEYVDKHESDMEGAQARPFQSKIKKLGRGGKGQLRPNPGWLPLHPDQRRGHEAPGRLETKKFFDSNAFVAKPLPDKFVELPKGSKKPMKAPNNFRPGRVLPAGHIWRPLDPEAERGPSHAGAPGHLPGAEQRQPPRPQNLEHHMKQVNEKKAKVAANLAKFEKNFGPAKKGKGSGHAHEAPGRMETHTTSHAPVRPAWHAPVRPARHASVGPARHAPARPAPYSRPWTPPARASGSKPAKAPKRKSSPRPGTRKSSRKPPTKARAGQKRTR